MARDRRRQNILQIQLTIKIALDLGTRDRDLEIVPLARGGRGIANPFYGRAPALFEFPQDQIVFEWIGTEGKVIAVGLEVEKDSGTLIDAAGNAFEVHRNFSVVEIRYVLGNGVREIGIGLHPVEELGVSLAIDRPRLVGHSRRRLSLFPLPAIDRQYLVVAFGLDPPDTYHVEEGGRLGADCL